MSVRVRFAPSPTGYLHVGGARTALYSYLMAQKNGGQFVLRVEDTDEERSTDESMKTQLDSIHWLGLEWNEGPNVETLADMGDYGPYRQSQRKDIYKKYGQQLLDQGQAYYCFLTDAEIDAQRESAKKTGTAYQVKSPYREMSKNDALQKIEAGEKAVVRFKVPETKTDYTFTDLVRKQVTFPSDMVGDFVILRSSGMPVYNFCCAIDDALMKMTHVLRAEEHLSNTLRQMMIYEALGFDLPQFGHLSIILGEDRQKLSKRHGATSIGQFKEEGYLPEALNNFLALLGWSSPKAQEILSMSDMIEQFTTDRLNGAAAVFDETKLKWVNATHLRALDHKDLWSRLVPFFKAAGLNLPADEAWQDRSLGVFKTSMEILSDAVELYAPLSQGSFKIFDEAKDALAWESTPAVITKWVSLLEAFDGEYLSEEDFSNFQNTIKTECGVKGKNLFMPIRVAIIGKPHGAELKQLVPLMQIKELIERAKACL